MSSLAETVLDHLSFVLNLRTPKFDGYGADAFQLRTRVSGQALSVISGIHAILI